MYVAHTLAVRCHTIDIRWHILYIDIRWHILLRFLDQHEEGEVAGAMFNVITLLENAQLNQTKKMKQSNILQYFKP